MKDLTKK